MPCPWSHNGKRQLDAESSVVSMTLPCIYLWGQGWCVPPRKAKPLGHLCREGRTHFLSSFSPFSPPPTVLPHPY